MLFELIIEAKKSGKTIEKIYEEHQKLARKRSKEKNKFWGECISCGEETCLQLETELCGPCCFGEADTAFGNW